MIVINFTKEINASAEKVWNTMLDDVTYRVWTKPFTEGSYYEGKWETGSTMKFLMTNSEGKPEGMYSMIREARPFEYIHIEHMGMVKDDVIDTSSEEVKKWAPAFEKYFLTEENGVTSVRIEMQTDESYRKMFDKMWAEALEALKNLCEK
jgi:hypothetical protein